MSLNKQSGFLTVSQLCSLHSSALSFYISLSHHVIVHKHQTKQTYTDTKIRYLLVIETTPLHSLRSWVALYHRWLGTVLFKMNTCHKCLCIFQCVYIFYETCLLSLAKKFFLILHGT